MQNIHPSYVSAKNQICNLFQTIDSLPVINVLNALLY